MPYYSTDSEEHRVNIGEQRDPLEEWLEDWYFEDPIGVAEDLVSLEDALEVVK